LNFAILMDTTTYVGMTPLVALEIPYVGSFDLDTNWWGTSPYVTAWVIHLIILSSCMWGNMLHLMVTYSWGSFVEPPFDVLDTICMNTTCNNVII
jgi:hypothetical protein